jgi:cold shock CspA family protein
MRVQATIITFFPERGFGFCRVDGEEQSNVFIHIRNANVQFLHEGDCVECEVETGERGRKAVNVKVLSFAS